MDGYCTECPGKCHWSNHELTDYQWLTEQYNIAAVNQDMYANFKSIQDEEIKMRKLILTTVLSYMKINSTFVFRSILIQIRSLTINRHALRKVNTKKNQFRHINR